ncbi:hypothetical protein SETIT_7G222000v2 [Setaria italica]|uniref:Uncharacterized protein n=1 Tax=Setaria italica TaxID=4555 RepID=A0A368RYC9_SETIT|nr:titin [Setaria italica]RCV35206.1 hypothetical protein SETIT_7G222000v2 [Setaria italica]
MDFLALPRRDLQALCKRNGVRANMTNAAMAEALAALPTVDGIGEYVKEPVTVPAPEVKAAAADEQQREKQGSPLPRGRRVTVKAVQTDRGKEDEKQESAKEDAPALAVGRRGPSRRARPAPVVASSVAVPVGKAEEAEDKQGGSKEEDRRRETNKEDPPAPVVGRRAASRRARPELAAESAAAGAVEEQRKKDGSPAPRGRRGAVKSSEPIRPDDCEEEEKELMREAGTDGAPALGVGRRGASRRARPAPALAEPAGKVTEEEKAPPIPRDRHVNLNDEEEDKKAATKPEEEEEDVPALGVGHRGACRRVRRAPAVSGKVAAEDEPRALIPRGHGVPVKSPEVIRLDDCEDEEKEDTKPDEKDDEAPAIGVGRRGANQCAPAPADSPATRRRAAASKAEAVGVTEEAVPMRATRHRKPTMKAVAAAEEKALPKATRRKAVKKTISQQEEQEKPQEAVPAPVSDVGCDNPEDPEEDSGPQKREQKQKDEDVVIIEDEILMEETPAQELLVTDQESMDHSTLQGQQVGVEKCLAPLASQEDSPIMGLVSMATEQAAEKDECANFQDGKGSCGSLDKGVSDKNHDAGEEMEMVSIIQGVQASPTEDHIEEVVTDDANHESEMRNFNEVLHGTEETSEANAEDDIVSQDKEDDIDELQADLADGSVLVDLSGNIKLFVEEETNEVNTEDGVSFQEKGDVAVDMALPETVAEAIPSGCSIDISCVEVEKAGYITSEMSESPAALDEDGKETNLYADICHADKPSEVVIGDSVSQVTVTDSKDVQEEKVVVITDDMPWSTAAMHEDVEEDQFQTIFIHAADSLPEVKMIDCEVEEKTAMIIDEQQQSTVTIDEDVVDNHLETDVVHADEHKEVVTIDEVPESTGTDDEVLEEDKAAVITEEVPQSTGKMDEDDKEDQFQTAFVHDDQVVTADSVPDLKITDCEPTEEDKTTLIADEKQQSTVTMDEDVVDDHFETDAVHADEHKKVVTADEVPELTGTDEVVEEDKAVVTAKEVPQSTVTDEEVEEDQFQTFFVHAEQVLTSDSVPDLKITDCEEKTTLIIDEKQQSTVTMDDADVSDYSETDELKEVATDDKMPQLTGTEGEVVEEDKAVVITDEELDVSEESKDRITPALVDDATESLSNSIITVEPAASIAADASVCKNTIEKNTTELVVMQDEKAVKVNKKSVDLYAFSLRQLKTKLKEGLNAQKNKEAKRVALARVDENVCRSHTKGQLQNLNLQQH